MITTDQRLVSLIKMLYGVTLYYKSGQEKQFDIIHTKTPSPFISKENVKIQPSIQWWHQELTINMAAQIFGIPSNLFSNTNSNFGNVD
jgi:hypothetical protein